MNTVTTNDAAAFRWEPQPDAGRLVGELLRSMNNRSPSLRRFQDDLLAKTGTRLLDWVEQIETPSDDVLADQLVEAGFRLTDFGDQAALTHPGGMFPRIVLSSDHRLSIKVESVVDFLAAQRMTDRPRIEGWPGATLRRAIAWDDGVRLVAVERHGAIGDQVEPVSPGTLTAVLHHEEAFRLRRRTFTEGDQAGFTHAEALIRPAVDVLGLGRACDLFFAAERDYWQRRNRAARVQRSRQDVLGLGWANHDHHTYRSSREHFARLIAVLELLGFRCRERFYAGREAGWGAQVLEHPTAGVVIFADVDLSPDEVLGDFAHEPLPPREELGTVGLWCRLHGEAFLEAGMRHLEARFDFDAAREQLAAQGIASMKPFTDLPYLKQAFTEGEPWPVRSDRLDSLLAAGQITSDQADRFRNQGAIGSHLEILQRDDGYKGFNQTGINEIIRDTDPRRQSE